MTLHVKKTWQVGKEERNCWLVYKEEKEGWLAYEEAQNTSIKAPLIFSLNLLMCHCGVLESNAVNNSLSFLIERQLYTCVSIAINLNCRGVKFSWSCENEIWDASQLLKLYKRLSYYLTALIDCIDRQVDRLIVYKSHGLHEAAKHCFKHARQDFFF